MNKVNNFLGLPRMAGLFPGEDTDHPQPFMGYM